MRRLGFVTLALLVLTACSGTPPEQPRKPASKQQSRKPSSGPLRTIARAPIPARLAHTAVWTGKEMLVWGGRGAPDKPVEPGEPLTSRQTLLADGAAYDPETDTWRVIAASPMFGRTGQNAVWTGSVLLVWGGEADREKLKDGAAYDPAANTWTALPDAPDTRSNAQTAWTGTEALFLGGSRKGGVAYNPATRTWRSLPDPPLRPYHRELSTWTGDELLIFVEKSDVNETLGAAYDPAHDTWRKLSVGRVSALFASGVVWTGDRAVLFSGWPERLDGGETNPLPRPLDPGGAYLPETDRWERVPLSPGGMSLGTPLWTGKEIVQWGGTGSGKAYHPDERRWRTIRLPKTPWREFPSLVWTGEEIIAWGGDSCPASASCFAAQPVEDGLALDPDRG